MPGLLRAADSLLLIIDVQARLAPHVHERERVVDNCAWLIGVARELEVPLLVSEHYPRGIGSTVDELRKLVPAERIMRKDHFSCVSEPACRERIEASGRNQIVIGGMEAHVCVMQTAIDLQQGGKAVYLVADAVSSRTPGDATRAIERMQRNGVEVVTREMVLFEWAHRGGTEQFRQLHRKYLKAPDAAGAGEQ
ncbi:MAG: hydrolase [Gammaproteobacteria bacterium]|nr:hydrolase [Gammaproteobacteria bacterium]